jgi:DNA repair exonuclease SbcCD ATPase subunit
MNATTPEMTSPNAVEKAQSAESSLVAKAQELEQRRAQLNERDVATQTALREKNEAHAAATLSGERTGALAAEIAELTSERAGIQGALRLLAEDEAQTAESLKRAKQARAAAEYSRALEDLDAANLAIQGMLRDFYDSTLAPMAEELSQTKQRVRDCDGEYNRLHGVAHLTRPLEAPEHIRPGNNVRFILAALERWSKGEPL